MTFFDDFCVKWRFCQKRTFLTPRSSTSTIVGRVPQHCRRHERRQGQHGRFRTHHASRERGRLLLTVFFLDHSHRNFIANTEKELAETEEGIKDTLQASSSRAFSAWLPLRSGTVSASMWRGLRKRVFSATSHPSMISTRERSPFWRVTRSIQLGVRDSDSRMKHAMNRMTAGFEYVGETMPAKQAQDLLSA
jgi:hypothetical protein